MTTLKAYMLYWVLEMPVGAIGLNNRGACNIIDLIIKRICDVVIIRRCQEYNNEDY